MKKDKLKLTDEQKKQCNMVIHGDCSLSIKYIVGLDELAMYFFRFIKLFGVIC